MIVLKSYYSPAFPAGGEQRAQGLSVRAAPTSSQYGTPLVFYPEPATGGFSEAGLPVG